MGDTRGCTKKASIVADKAGTNQAFDAFALISCRTILAGLLAGSLATTMS
jgi:hypothetical protein